MCRRQEAHRVPFRVSIISDTRLSPNAIRVRKERLLEGVVAVMSYPRRIHATRKTSDPCDRQ
jgi:hypothetical protein